MKLGNLATGADFFGRETEREDFWRFIEGNHLVLSGPRRLGKSSLIHRLCEEAGQWGLMARHLDVQGIDTCEEFFTALDRAFPENSLRAYLAAVSDTVRQWWGRVRKFEAKLPGEIGGLAVELDKAKARAWYRKAAELDTRLSDAPVLILIDEFSVFLDKLIKQDRAEAESLLSWLRAWRVRAGVACRFMFSGSIGLNALLENHGLSTTFNDCHPFVLGPFRLRVAQAMLDTFAAEEGWALEPATRDHLCRRIGWLSPFYLNLLLNESMGAARDRLLETAAGARIIEMADVDDGYERLLDSRSRFHHWERRLGDHLREPELGFCKAILTFVAKSDAGLTMRQLMARLTRREADPDKREALLQSLRIKLAEEGYLSQPDARGGTRFISSLLRDWWKRNHV